MAKFQKLSEFKNSEKLRINRIDRTKSSDRPNNRNIIANSRKPVNRWLCATTFRRNTMQFHSMDNRTTSYSNACYAIIRLKLQHQCRGRCKTPRFRIHEISFRLKTTLITPYNDRWWSIPHESFFHATLFLHFVLFKKYF